MTKGWGYGVSRAAVREGWAMGCSCGFALVAYPGRTSVREDGEAFRHHSGCAYRNGENSRYRHRAKYKRVRTDTGEAGENRVTKILELLRRLFMSDVPVDSRVRQKDHELRNLV